jgi:aldose 1-epimerase
MTVTLAAGEFVLVLSPGRGGSVLSFDMGGEAIFRPTDGPHVLDLSCFPLVPFSNRIADGRFQHAGRAPQLAPNFPSTALAGSPPGR